MEISHVPVSKSLGNCEHLYNQMSSESLGEFEKVRTWLPQSPEYKSRWRICALFMATLH